MKSSTSHIGSLHRTKLSMMAEGYCRVLERHALFARRGDVRKGEFGPNRIGIAIRARRCRGAEKALGELEHSRVPRHRSGGGGGRVEGGPFDLGVVWGRERAAVAIPAAQLRRPTSVQTVPGDNHERPSFSSVWRDRRGVEALFANANPSMSKFTVPQRSFARSLVQIPRQDRRRGCRRVSRRVFAVGLPPSKARPRRCGREKG